MMALPENAIEPSVASSRPGPMGRAACGASASRSMGGRQSAAGLRAPQSSVAVGARRTMPDASQMPIATSCGSAHSTSVSNADRRSRAGRTRAPASAHRPRRRHAACDLDIWKTADAATPDQARSDATDAARTDVAEPGRHAGGACAPSRCSLRHANSAVARAARSAASLQAASTVDRQAARRPVDSSPQRDGHGVDGALAARRRPAGAA